MDQTFRIPFRVADYSIAWNIFRENTGVVGCELYDRLGNFFSIGGGSAKRIDRRKCTRIFMKAGVRQGF